jgi:hypothetical protein
VVATWPLYAERAYHMMDDRSRHAPLSPELLAKAILTYDL